MTRDIVVTGGMGFIGSAVVAELNKRGVVPHVIDRWKDNDPKWRNIKGLRFIRTTKERLAQVAAPLPFDKKPIVVALGASVDTREGMSETLWTNNVDDLLDLSQYAGKFIYASSGATYGAEEKDFRERVDGLTPLNPYAATKLYVDNALFGDKEPSLNTYALRFFNVYGPREAHKGDMASLATKGLLGLAPLYHQKGSYIVNKGTAQHTHWSLFRHPSGETIKRDFIFVDDVASIICHFVKQDDIKSGIYNVGTGEARSFEDLVTAVEKLPIEYTDLPDSLKHQYQRYTCADITRLRKVAGYTKPFTSLEQGVELTREWMKREGLIL